MPEEKKEKFTFSDKIKNSKPAGSKSFAKSSAKIGRDGKPKATLFERTRRDAPFFIAALVALLLLPFLYRYSGQASEEQFLTPGSEETAFDPERYGFDTAMVEDPDGQIAQLAGRDSLSLIKGWGSNEEEDYGRDDMDLDASAGYEGEGEYSADRSSTSDIDIEENTTNIYKRRAGAATRAAFRRTKIGTLNPAGLRRPGGSRLGINHWGGGLKQAARKVPGASGPAPKPVSLQPLRAAAPARSSFGRGAAVAARTSRDNMGKADPREALRDSYVKPVDPTRIGGLNLFSAGPGGGSGKLERNINIGKGQEPWWWDMMKTRMQKEWDARFNRKWDWIKFWDKLAQDIIGPTIKGLGCCLLTGDPDCDPDNFLGVSAGGGTNPTCCGYKESDLKVQYGDELAKAGSLEAFCKGTMRQTLRDLKHDKSCGYKAGMQSEVALGPLAARWKCMGAGVGAYLSGELGLKSAGMDCTNMPDLYQVTPSGEARKWNTYIYVTARNYFPEELKSKFPHNDAVLPMGGNLLCAQADRKHGGDSLNITGRTSQGVGHGEEEVGAKNVAKEHVNRQNASNAKNIPSEQEGIRSEIYKIDPEAVVNGCVIYVQQGDTFDYQVFKNKIIDQFKSWSSAPKEVAKADARRAFEQLDLLSVESFAAKDKLAYAAAGGSGHELKNMLPMLYWRFDDAYVRHKKITHKKDGSRDNVYKAKYRVDGVDMVHGPICYFDNLMVDCQDDQATPQGTVTFKQGYKGLSMQTLAAMNPEQEARDNLVVTAQLQPLNGDQTPEFNMHQPGNGTAFAGRYSVTYTLNPALLKTTNKEGKEEPFVGNIIWRVYRNARTQDQAFRHSAVSTATCTFNLSGDVVQEYIETHKCTPGAMEYNPAQKVQGQCQKQRTCDGTGQWGPWVDNPQDADCNAAPVAGVVSFYDSITKVPCQTDITSGNRRLQQSTGCLTWNSCKLTVDRALLLPLDNDTKQYVARAKAKFDQANAGANITLSYNEDSLSVANLIDAIMIDPDNGTVPANTVCLLGKTIGASAKDPQAESFDNIFGVFLAFMGYDAASFPSQYTHDCNGTSVRNLRFRCMSSGKNYYWGGYVNSGDRTGYKRNVDNGVWKSFPLKALLREPLPADGINLIEKNDEKSRQTFHKRYADLLKREPCQYESNRTVRRDDVLEYINILCAHGDKIKPEAGKRYDCSKLVQKGTYGNKQTDCANPPCN